MSLSIRYISIKSVNYLTLKQNIFVLIGLVLLFDSSIALSGTIAGVDDDVKEAVTYQAQAAVGYEYATSSAMIDMPSSVAAVTCFADAATASADVAGEIFSGKISKEANEMLANSLESHFDNFSWDSILTYDTELKVNASFHVGLSISVGSDQGPTVKNVECKNLGTLWEKESAKAGGAYPVLAEAVAKGDTLTENNVSTNQTAYSNSGGNTVDTPGKKFIAEWTASSNDSLEAANRLRAKETSLRDRYRDMDMDFSVEEDPCTVLLRMSGSSFNCADVK